MRKVCLTAALLALTSSSYAIRFPSFTVESFTRKSKPIVFSMGPKVFWKKRKAAGGAKILGWQGGLDTRIERIKSRGVYWGLFFDYSWGRSSGYSATGISTYAKNADTSLDARIGYCAQPIKKSTFKLIPYVGLGYYKAIYRFVPPSVVNVKYLYKTPFFSTGLLLSRFFKPCWSVGLNLQVQYTFDGKRVIRSPENRSSGPVIIERFSHMGDEFQYLVELPVTYLITQQEKGYSLQMLPYFSYRHFGTYYSRAGSFSATRFITYGFSLLGTYRF